MEFNNCSPCYCGWLSILNLNSNVYRLPTVHNLDLCYITYNGIPFTSALKETLQRLRTKHLYIWCWGLEGWLGSDVPDDNNGFLAFHVEMYISTRKHFNFLYNENNQIAEILCGFQDLVTSGLKVYGHQLRSVSPKFFTDLTFCCRMEPQLASPYGLQPFCCPRRYWDLDS